MLPLSQSGCSPALPGFSSWFAAGFSLYPSHGSSARGSPGLSPSQGTGHSSSAINKLLPCSPPAWVRQLRAQLSTQEEPCVLLKNLPKEILKPRWHQILKKLKNRSERSMSVAHWIWELRGCREALAGFSNIILRSCLQILTIPACADWVSAGAPALEPAGEPAMFFYGKSAGNPRAWDCNAVESTPCLVGTFVPKKPNGLGTKFDFLFQVLYIFPTSCQQAAQWV